MAKTTDDKTRKVSDKYALNAQGEDCADYTEATIARYTSILGDKPSVQMDFAPQLAAMIAGGIAEPLSKVTVAFAIEGFLNKAGHASNKARNNKVGGVKVPLDERTELEAFLQNALEGGWTNREGGNEVNVQGLWEAYAEFRNADVEAVKRAWQGYTKEDGTIVAPWTEAQKKAVRDNADVKAIVDRRRAEKSANAARLAREARGETAPDALPEL